MTQKAARPHALEAAVEVMVGSDGGSARDVEQVGAVIAGCGLAPPAQVRGERASRSLHAPTTRTVCFDRFASYAGGKRAKTVANVKDRLEAAG